jgi:hypothetical protein
MSNKLIASDDDEDNAVAAGFIFNSVGGAQINKPDVHKLGVERLTPASPRRSALVIELREAAQASQTRAPRPAMPARHALDAMATTKNRRGKHYDVSTCSGT